MTAGLVSVEFYGDTLWAGSLRGAKPKSLADVLVAVKPTIERLGLDWSSQLQRLKRDDLLSRSMVVTTMESGAGARETVCLPMPMIPGFLFGISTERIADPAVRSRINVYKQECFTALYEHFFGFAASRRSHDEASLLRERRKAVELTLKVSGRAAAREVWNTLGLPTLSDTGAGDVELMDIGGGSAAADTLIVVRRFCADRIEIRAGGVEAAGDLLQAYNEWAAGQGAPQLTVSSFGTALRRMGFAKGSDGRRRHYRGLRLKPIQPVTLQ